MTAPAAETAAEGLAVHRVDGDAQAARTVALLADRLAGGAVPSDSAVLARVGSALLPVQVALTEAGIPHTAPLDATILGRTGVRTALAYLRLALDTDRIGRDDLLDTLNRPARKVKSAVLPLLRGSRWSIGQLDQLAELLEGQHRERFAGYLGDLHHLEHAITDGADTARCLWIVRNRIGLGEAMDALDASRSRPEGSSHGDDLDALEQLAALHPDPATFRAWLADRLRTPGDPDGVTLSTVHRVKGLEWPHVVVFAVNQGLFPHRLAEDVEEERRVLHVAVTRCREQVDVVADRSRTSPFVEELHRRSTRARADVTPPTPAVAATPVRHADGRLAATPGCALTVAGGIAGTIVTVAADHAILHAEVDGLALRLRVEVGEPVVVEERAEVLGPPPPDRGRRAPGDGARPRRPGDADDGAVAPSDEAIVAALRSWRTRTAAEHGIPAYLVFHDRHLHQIASRRPATLLELAHCPGVGPAKLERYGDDLLAVLDAHPD